MAREERCGSSFNSFLCSVFPAQLPLFFSGDYTSDKHSSAEKSKSGSEGADSSGELFPLLITA